MDLWVHDKPARQLPHLLCILAGDGQVWMCFEVTPGCPLSFVATGAAGPIICITQKEIQWVHGKHIKHLPDLPVVLGHRAVYACTAAPHVLFLWMTYA
jgi:hypothetical protein